MGETGPGINDDGSLHKEATASFALQYDGKDDLGAVPLPGQRREMEGLRPPPPVLELLHQGTLSGASEDQK